MTACAVELMSSCQNTTPELKEGVPMTIQASVVAPPETKTFYEYTDDKTLEGYWDEEEAITVVSFDENGITAVDKFTSTGIKGRYIAEFSGIWRGNERDKVICLYPPVDSYAGYSIFDNVRESSQTIYIRNLSTPLSPLKNDDPISVSEVDVMLGELTFGTADDGDDYWDGGVENNDNRPHVCLKHLIGVFRIEATLKSLPFKGEPYYMARINTLRISAVDPDAEEEEWGLYGDPVFVRFAGLDVTTYSYTGRPFAIERGPLDYYLINSGNYSDFHMGGENGKEPVTKTFYVPVRFDGDLQAGYELRFQFGGTYDEYYSGAPTYVREFPGISDKRKTITSKLPLENGKIYSFKVTI